MKRAVIYARFSSDMQREESIDAQVRACKEYINRKGYELVNIYADEAKSGTEITNRTEYNKMIVDALSHDFDVVIFHKIDRNSRNELNYYTFKDTFAKLGITYEYASQNIDSSPEGQMMESVLVGLAAYYSRNLSKETKKGLNENAYKGLFNGGTPPLGYQIVDRKYVINENEAKIVRKIFELYLSGLGYSRITQVLAGMGYKTRNGKNFGKNSLYDILGNQKYIGIYTFNRVQKQNGKRNTHAKPSDDMITIEGVIPPIIDRTSWDAVQALRERNRNSAASYKAQERYLLTGKLQCGVCGSSIGSHTINKGGKTYRYYVCLHKERVSTDKCSLKSIVAEDLDKWVVDTIRERLLSPEGIESVVSSMYDYYKSIADQKEEKIKSLTLERSKAMKKLDNIYNILEINGTDAFNLQRLNSAKATITSIDNEIAATRLSDSVNISKEEIKKALLAMVDSIEARQSLVSLFVDKIIIDNENIQLLLTTEKVSIQMVPRTRTVPNRKIFTFSTQRDYQ